MFRAVRSKDEITHRLHVGGHDPLISRACFERFSHYNRARMEQRAPTHLMSEQEYLALERVSDIKHEFFQGEIFAMAGGTPYHSLIAANLITALNRALQDRGCFVFTADLRVKVEATGLQTYPDVPVVCGTPEFTAEQPKALLNPTLIAEVLSESTEAYDRGTKFHHYRKIPSLTTYLLVSQDAPTVEQLIRQSEFNWEYRVATGLEAVIELPAFGVQLALKDVFAGVTFGAHPLSPTPPA
jgi:Uma2 family endonuclease